VVGLVARQAPWSRVIGFGLGLLRHPGKLAQALRLQARLLGVPSVSVLAGLLGHFVIMSVTMSVGAVAFTVLPSLASKAGKT